MTANPNFEVVCNTGLAGCQQFTRYNSVTGNPWSDGVTTSISNGAHVSMIVSQPWRNLEAVVVTGGGGLEHWWRNPTDLPGVWRQGADILSQTNQTALAAGGPPSLIQAVSYGETAIGNFELLVPSNAGGVLHFTRNNNVRGYPWSYRGDSGFGGSYAFGDQVQGVALIQSDYGDTPPGPGELFGGPGTLECVVIRETGDLVHFYLDQGTNVWTPSVTITSPDWSGAADQGNPSPGCYTQGAPAFIQPYGGYTRSTHENFEVVVPAAPYAVPLTHFTRDNSPAGGKTWKIAHQFGGGNFPALIWTNYANLEMVVSGSGDTQGLLAHW